MGKSPAPSVKIVSCCNNSEQWIAYTINSVKLQTYKDFEFYLYLDSPSDNTAEIARKTISNDKRFIIIEGSRRVYAAISRWILFEKLKNTSDRDIIVILDGDDWLSNTESLEIVVTAYMNNKVVATHGNFITENGVVCNWSRDYRLETKMKNDFRQRFWRATHLRSFKYGLLKYLNSDILYDVNDIPFRSATDMALFLPILELAGVHSMFINYPVYVYNTRSSQVTDENRKLEQQKNAVQIREKEKYYPLKPEQIEKLL